MISVHVQHFLNQEGIDYFPEWIEKGKKVLKTFDGFISMKQILYPTKPEETHLILNFDTEKNLKRWSKSAEHHNYLYVLREFTLKKHESSIFEVEDMKKTITN